MKKDGWIDESLFDGVPANGFRRHIHAIGQKKEMGFESTEPD